MVVASASRTGLTANITSPVTLYDPTTGKGAGLYRVSWNNEITTAAGTSSTLGVVTIAYYNSGNHLTTLVTGTNNTGNTTSTTTQATATIKVANVANAIAYQTNGYLSSGSPQMVYASSIALEYLGPY